MPLPLPIDAHLGTIAAAVERARAAVVVAEPGAGKSTRVPPALLSRGKLILLQPRRIAARALARRIASEQGLALREEVGWQVRLERQFTPRTRLLVATEGILTARLQEDPLLSDFATVVIDEVHERSLHVDMALALARQAWLARDDLALVVMSATVDPEPLARFLGGCPVVRVPGSPHEVVVAHAEMELAPAVREVLARPGGHLLCFLPGAGAIRRAQDALAGSAPPGVAILPLHGSLPADAQELALAAHPGRKVILATNVAETSLTVEGVTDVIDGGLEKVLRYDADRGLDRLEVERVSMDSARQRAGRAGRTGPGRALRLWDARLRLPEHREPEIARADLAGPVLEILAWGGDPGSFEWLEPPPPGRLAAALALLARLGALEAGRITPAGRAMRALPLPPRLARVLLAAGASRRAAAACAVLAERDFLRGSDATTDCDVLLRVDALSRAPEAVRRSADDLAARARELARGGAGPEARDDAAIRRAFLAGYPDRVAQRREPGSPRLLLASGRGATLARESGVREGDYLVALDATTTGSDVLVRLASRVERAWLTPTSVEVVHELDKEAGAVRARARSSYESLVLDEHPTRPDPVAAAPILAAALLREPLTAESERFLRRARLAGASIDLEALAARACAGRTTMPRLDLEALVEGRERARIAAAAPDAIRVPSGRAARLDYREDGSVVLAIKLQELFGLADSPRIGPGGALPVVMELLSPAGRPVQTTRDLRSFWNTTYPEVRRELRARYPKHPWPEEPWSAVPTARTRRAPSRSS